ncbi:hypothetical protein [Nocardia acidivorans]|uniref:hypothetical protein n=1 Tax=Nocardia acidivorans TaxID=404580 RepID=UPI00082B2A40|nr:hypothetical protein [Nocardia acidivorans]
MSDTTANGGRARRRALRQAGPPVADDHSVTEVRTSPAAASVVSTPVAKSDPASVADSAPSLVKASERSTAANAESSPADIVEAAVATEADADSAAGDIDSVAPAAAAASDSEHEPKADSEAEAEPVAKSRKRFGSLDRLARAAAVVALVSLLGLFGSGGVFLYHQHRADALQERRAEYIQVAKQAVINLSTMKDGSVDADIDRILSVASGELKAEYSQNKDLYKKVFEQIKVQSTGTVLAAAIESDSVDAASVLVLAQQTVSNAGTDQPQQKDYRFRVTLKRDGDTVTASGLEFVA